MQETNQEKKEEILNDKVQKAIENCRNELLKDPNNSRLYIKLGDLYLKWHIDIYQAKQYIDEAINQYQMASELSVDNGEIYYKLGRAFFFKGELERALNYFNLALENGANKAQTHYMIAKTLKKKDRYTDALEEVELALNFCFLKSSRIHYLKSRLLKVVSFKTFKNSLESFWELILSLLTLPFDFEAIKNVKEKLKIITIFPFLMKGWFVFTSKEYDKAIEIYTKAVNKMPGFAPLYCLLGDIYRALGKYDEAIVEYKMARWLDNLCLPAYQSLAQAYEELGDYDNAINIYLAFIKVHSKNAILHSNVANLYFMKGDIETATMHYQSAITLSTKPNWLSIVTQTLGYIQQNIVKNLDAAIASFQSSNMLTPKEIDTYISLGSAFYDKEDYDNAFIIYRRALELSPHNSKIHCNLGYLYWGTGDITEAIREYELSIKYDAKYDIAHNNLGVIYLDDLAHIQKAIDCFKAAVEANPNYALAHYNLARALSIKGEKIEAAKHYQIALDVNTITNEMDSDEIQEKLNNLFN